MTTLPFVKGHGTLNDFVLIPDHHGGLELTARDVIFLADRRAGIGADGVIRVAPTSDAPEQVQQACPGTRWFMDYRNQDGSIGEMCGNGTRVFAAYVVREGLEEGPEFDIATRDGIKRITVLDDGFRTDLGSWRLSRESEATERGMDCVVQVHGAPDPLPGLSLDVGNPHTVVALPPGIDLGGLDLSTPPRVDPHPSQGSNVEFVRVVDHGQISMRVHERGVGETRSCGTGAAASALATWWWAGRPQDRLDWQVDVPGGRLQVRIDGGRVQLAGPAQLVAEGTVSLPA